MEDSHSFLYQERQYRKCPRCKNGELDTRIKRGKLVKSLLFWADIKRYSCNSCGRKVYMLGKTPHGIINKEG